MILPVEGAIAPANTPYQITSILGSLIMRLSKCLANEGDLESQGHL